jgi:predicted alpha/beta hydrolase family esterase
LLAAARYRAPRQAPGLPILLLASQHDKLVDSRCSQALAEAWGSLLMSHPDAGHDLPLDDPHWVAHTVQHWLKASGI